jgi:hypothetical protein
MVVSSPLCALFLLSKLSEMDNNVIREVLDHARCGVEFQLVFFI